MPAYEIALLVLAAVFVTVIVALIVKAVLWTGRDARKRGFRPVWLLQFLVVVDFPWPWLIYYLVTRNLDQGESATTRSPTALHRSSR